MARYLESELQLAYENNDGSLDQEDFTKIRNYYGFGVPAIVGEGFCTLRGEKMALEERIASTSQGVITGLFDDFFDKTNLSFVQIKEMMHQPFDFIPGSSLESLFTDFLKKIHQNTTEIEKLNSAFEQVFDVQVSSLSQEEGTLNREALLNLTIAKGGFSLLFYRSVFKHPLIEGEHEAIYQVGGLMQMANDLFDVYKDSRHGTRTLITYLKQIDEFRSIYKNQLQTAIDSIKRLEYPPQQIKKYLHKLSLGISRCMVCLDQLEKLEKRNTGEFNPDIFHREQLLCDMEKWKNRFRSLSHYLQTDL